MTTLPPVSYNPGPSSSSYHSHSHESTSHSQHPPSSTSNKPGWWRRPSTASGTATLGRRPSHPLLSQAAQPGYTAQASQPAQPALTRSSSGQASRSGTLRSTSSANSHSHSRGVLTSPTSPASSARSPTSTTSDVLQYYTASSGPASPSEGGHSFVYAELSPRSSTRDRYGQMEDMGQRSTFSQSSSGLSSSMRERERERDMRDHQDSGGGGSLGFSIATLRSVFKGKKRPALELQPQRTPAITSSSRDQLARTTSYVVPEFSATQGNRSRAYTASSPPSSSQAREPARSRSFTVDQPRPPTLPRYATSPSLSSSAGPSLSLPPNRVGKGEKPPRPPRSPLRPTQEGENLQFLHELSALVGREEKDVWERVNSPLVPLEDVEAETGSTGQAPSEVERVGRTRPSISTASVYSDGGSAPVTASSERPSTDATDSPVPTVSPLRIHSPAAAQHARSRERSASKEAREKERSRLQAKAKRHGWTLALPPAEEDPVSPPASSSPESKKSLTASPPHHTARSLSPSAMSTGNRHTAYMTQGFVLSSSPDDSRLSRSGLPMPDNSPIVRPVSEYAGPGGAPPSLGSSPSSPSLHSLGFYRAHDAPSALSLAGTIGTVGTVGTSDGTSARGSMSGGLKAIFGSYNPPESVLGALEKRRGSKSRAQSPSGSHRSRRSEKSTMSKEEKEEKRGVSKKKSTKNVRPSTDPGEKPSSASKEASPVEGPEHTSNPSSSTILGRQQDGETDAPVPVPAHSSRPSLARPKTAPNPTRPSLDLSPIKDLDEGRRPSAPAIVQTPSENASPVSVSTRQHIIPPAELARLMQPSPSPPEIEPAPRRPSTANSIAGRRGSEAGSMRSTISADRSYFFPSPLPSPSDREFPPWGSAVTRSGYDYAQGPALPSLPPPRRRARNPPPGVTLSPLNTTSRPSSSSSGSRLSVPTSSSAISPSGASTPSTPLNRPNTSPRISNSRHFIPQRRPPDYAVPPLPDPGITAAIVAAAAKEEEKKKVIEEVKPDSKEKKKKTVKTGEKLTRKPSFLNFDVEDGEDDAILSNPAEPKKSKSREKQSDHPKLQSVTEISRQQSFLDFDDVRQSFDSGRSESDGS